MIKVCGDKMKEDLEMGTPNMELSYPRHQLSFTFEEACTKHDLIINLSMAAAICGVALVWRM